MGTVESLHAMLERQLIRSLVWEVVHAQTEETRQRNRVALEDLLAHADPTLDVSAFDTLTWTFLEHAGLWPPNCTRKSHRSPRKPPSPGRHANRH